MSAGRAALVYAVASSLWIYASDGLLRLFVEDPLLLSRISTWKGLFFVGTTTPILYFFLLRPRGAGPARPESGLPARSSIIFPTVAFISLALLAVAVGTGFFFRFQQGNQAAVEKQMRSLALLKKEELERWLYERRADLLNVTTNPFFVKRVERWLAAGSPAGEDEEGIRARIETLRRVGAYSDIVFVDRSGKSRLPAAAESVEDHRSGIAASIAGGGFTLIDLHAHRTPSGDRRLEVSFVAPLATANGTVGALLLTVDASKRLLPILQSLPAQGTSELLLLRRDGEKITYLSPVRGNPDAPLNVTVPAGDERQICVRALRGSGLVEGIDYRGVPAIGFAYPLEGTPWTLLARVDRDEAVAPLKKEFRLVVLLITVFTLAGWGSIVLWWRQQHSGFLAAHSRAEAERRSLATRMDELARQANDAIFLFDETGQVVDANDAAVGLYGYTMEELRGLRVPDLRTPEAVGDLDVHLRAAENEGGTRFETLHRRRDGTAFPVEVSSRRIRIGDRSYYQSIVRDISERRSIDAALRQSEQRFRNLSQEFHSLLDALPDSICLLNAENRIIWSNIAASSGLSLDSAALEGMLCYQAKHRKESPCSECATAIAFATGRLQEKTVSGVDGSTVEVRAVPLFDESGKVRNVIEIARDITGQRKLEAELRHAQKMEALGTLAGGIAHDFNNILMAIAGYASLLGHRLPADPKMHAYLSHILAGAERATVLTNGLLAYCRKGTVDLRPVDLNDIVRNVDRFLSRIIGEDIDVVVATSDRMLHVLADAGQIDQVIMNLATNARDAMPAGGRLEIRTGIFDMDESFIAAHGFGRAGRYAVLTASDTGHGIERDILERIFEPFYTTKETGKGTGLGLAIVYGIVKQHGGYVEVASRPGEGSVFTVYLPLTRELPRAVREEREEVPPGGRETVLLVEDDPDVRGYVRELLAGAGYAVLEASDGEEGAAVFAGRADEIDMVVMDIVMPRGNGRETFEKMRAVRPGVKALFMSGYTDEAISVKGIDSEGLEFIGKPVRGGVLLARMREILDAAGSSGEA